jgi:hypothetical protein
MCYGRLVVKQIVVSLRANGKILKELGTPFDVEKKNSVRITLSYVSLNFKNVLGI